MYTKVKQSKKDGKSKAAAHASAQRKSKGKKKQPPKAPQMLKETRKKNTVPDETPGHQILIPVATPTGIPVQKTDADVFLGGRNKGHGSRVRGGLGGVNHAEQLAWNNASQSVQNWADTNKNKKPKADATIKFLIDRPVCGGCQGWFEGAFWNTIKGWENTYKVNLNVVVSVDYQNRYRATMLTGPGTVWGGVGG